MPASAVPFVIAIVLAFVAFIVVVGGVSIWSEWPKRRRSAWTSPAARADGGRSADRSEPRAEPRVSA